MRSYRITVGSFKLADGTLKNRGERIELDEDVADLHVGRVEPWTEEGDIEPEAPQPPDDPEA